jgi:UDP-4-amino-4-deoxy-L-arabinose formyltransferase/UDP-glucuronic acid dehydrogenase (UDP-4-keto-hexauronic acid decarboxylating)
MKAIVLAYHNLGCVGIEALLRHGFQVAAVFTHADDPAEKIWFRSVAGFAVSRGLQVYMPEDINAREWVERARQLEPDVLFSFYYRRLIRRPLLDLPGAGCLNLHGSLLPGYRGRCPVNWALINGEKETGVTLHYMTPRPDDGDIVDQERVPIHDDDTAASLHAKLLPAADRLLDRALPLVLAGNAPRLPQDHSQASYFGGRTPDDGLIDWSRPAIGIRNLVRAVTRPYPGAFTWFRGRKLYVWVAGEIGGTVPMPPSTVISADPLVVACAEGALWIEDWEWEAAGRELRLEAGVRLGSFLDLDQ